MRKKRNPNETFFLGQGTPLLLHTRVQIGLVIGPEGRQFDSTYYRLTLGATRPYRYTSRTLLLIRRRGERVEIIENAAKGKQLLSEPTYKQLRERMIELFKTITVEETSGG
jgi:hypothetical protein